MVWTSNSSKNKRYVFSPKRTHWLWGPSSPLFSEYLGSFFQVKRPGRELKSLLSSAEVKNEKSCTSIPSTCLRAAHRVNFPFYPIVCFVRNVLFFPNYFSILLLCDAPWYLTRTET